MNVWSTNAAMLAPDVDHFRTLSLNVANIIFNFINELSIVNDHLTSMHTQLKKTLSL
jgi:hypothetical protein